MRGSHRWNVLDRHLVVLGQPVVHAELSDHQVHVARDRAIERRLLVESVENVALCRFLLAVNSLSIPHGAREVGSGLLGMSQKAAGSCADPLS